MADLQLEVADIQHETEILKRQRINMGNEIRQLEERLDTFASPPWKKLLWLLQGWRWYRVGRWYPPWTELRARMATCLSPRTSSWWSRMTPTKTSPPNDS